MEEEILEAPVPAPEGPAGVVITKDTINAVIQAANLVSEFKDAQLTELGAVVVEEYELDEESRKEWLDTLAEATDLTRQAYETKRDAAGSIVANVKMPVIGSAILQFSSRAYPNIVKGRSVVKTKTIGNDPGGVKAARADRISTFMNTQILDDMDDWEAEMDLLLTLLALNGCMFKKVYRDAATSQTRSELTLPEDMVVHFYAKSFEPRATHIVYKNKNEIESCIRAGEFVEHDFDNAPVSTDKDTHEEKRRDITDTGRGVPYLEQHRWWDLDGDGFEEPCIVTVHYSTRKVVRVTPRFDVEDVVFSDDGEQILSIKPTQYFVKYSFLRAFDGSFYETGFGTLLSPICRTINTNVNQLLDAGTAANNGGGFIGRGLRLGKSGSVRFKRDEYHLIKSTGDDLRKSILPFPFKEPSGVLFQLLGLMMDQAKELSAMSDLMAGQNPPKDQPATTTLALLEQGLKVFGSVFKRIFLALKTEFAMVYRLNRMYLSEIEYKTVLDNDKAVLEDWIEDDKDVVPISDGAELTDVQRSLKAQMLLGMRQPYNSAEIERRFYEAMGIEDYAKLLPPEGYKPPPDPELELKKAELELKGQEIALKQAEMQVIIAERKSRAFSLWADAIKSLADAQAKEDGTRIEQMKVFIDSVKTEIDFYNRMAGGANGSSDAAGRVAGSVPVLENPGPDNSGGVAPTPQVAGGITQPGAGALAEYGFGG